MIANKKLKAVVTELFMRKLDIILVFISKSYFIVSKTIWLNTTH